LSYDSRGAIVFSGTSAFLNRVFRGQRTNGKFLESSYHFGALLGLSFWPVNA
jgi:hypothetical protein